MFHCTLTGETIDLAIETRPLIGEKRISIIGDCLVPGTIQAAVLSGLQAARRILSGSDNDPEFRRDQIATDAV